MALKTTVAREAAEILDSMSYLHHAFGGRLANASAVARMLKPLVEARTGRPVSLAALVSAVKEYSRHFDHPQKSRRFLDLLKSTRIILKSGFAELHYGDVRPASEALAQLENQNYDRYYAVRKSDEMAVYADGLLLEKILAKAAPSERFSDRAVITLNYDARAFAESIGGLHYYTSQFELAGVPILAVFTTPSYAVFVIHEKDAPRAYKQLADSLAAFKRA